MARISASKLKAECLKERYKTQLARTDVFPTLQNWEYIIENAMEGIGPELYRKYLVSWLTDPREQSDYHQYAIEQFPVYLQAVSRQYALKVIYSDVTSSPEATVNAIHQAQLFDALSLLEILLGDQDNDQTLPFVIECLDAFQPDYSAQDLLDMQQLAGRLAHLPTRGSITHTRSLLGSAKRYICPRGHSNDAEVMFCRNETCGLNIFGLTEAQAQAIDQFQQKVKTLARLLRTS